MSNRYDRAFARLKDLKQKAFIPFTVLGYPDAKRCLESIELMITAGSTALELGIAFSDPMADGPTIQAATQQVIKNGFTLADAFELLTQIRAAHQNIPIGLLVYYNTVICQGVAEFYRRAKAAGVDGILIADLPPESAAEVTECARANGIQQIFIVSPLTSQQRLARILQFAGGFIYAVSRLGITGVHEEHDRQLSEILPLVRQNTQLPVCVGFGISSPQKAKKMFELGADGVISGSRIIDLLGADGDNLSKLAQYLKEMTDNSCSQQNNVLKQNVLSEQDSSDLWRCRT